MSTSHRATAIRLAGLTTGVRAAPLLLLLGVCCGGSGCQQPAGRPASAHAITEAKLKRARPKSPARGRAHGGSHKAAAKRPRPASPRQVDRMFEHHFAKLAGLTFAALRKRHAQAYLPAHGLNVGRAAFYRGFTQDFRLSWRARRALKRRGFVVVPQPDRSSDQHGRDVGKGPANIFYDVFAADLPVFVSADAILHAWHRSFDTLMSGVESGAISAAFGKVLALTMGRLDQRTPMGRDAYDYLAVARQLLDPRWRPPPRTAPLTAPILRAVSRRRPARIQLMGQRVLVDFRQLVPRGRYNRASDLQQYFRAMAWLARVTLVLLEPRHNAPGPTRQEAAARAIVHAMKASGALKPYRVVQRFYDNTIGRALDVSPLDLLRLCHRAGNPSCRPWGATPGPGYRALGSPAYSTQSRARNRQALRFSLMPQRFTYGTWVMSRLTTPRLPTTGRVGRSMARDLDVAFALGADRALDHYGSEVKRRSRRALPAALEAVRRTLQKIPPSRVSSSVYSHRLEALAALSQPNVSKKLPKVLRTAAWHDRKLEATLASWTEQRYDAGPLVQPSIGGDGCQYPKGYVEPVPKLYEALARAAVRFAAALPPHTSPRSIPGFLRHWRRVMARLARLARLELAGKPMQKKDLAFLSRTVDRHLVRYGGDRSYDGWYPSLYWNHGWRPPKVLSKAAKKRSLSRRGGRTAYGNSAESRLAVADLHMDGTRGRILQGAVGHANLMIVAVDAGGTTALYGGPAYSYYALNRRRSHRMSMKSWKWRATRGRLPRRPGFARRFHVDR